MDFPDDDFDTPQESRKVAVVRRQGETRGQMQGRKAGFSDEQTGYGSPRGASPIARSYQISAQNQRAKMREAGAQDRFDERMGLAERKMALEEGQFAAQQRIQASAQADKKAALDQLGYFMDEEDALAQKFGRYSQPFLAATLSMAKKYPAAVMADPRLGAKLNHYGETFAQNGGHPDLPTALWEAAQFDPAELPPDQARQYLGTIAAKYPAIAADKSLASILSDKAKQVAVREADALAKKEGLQPRQMTVETPGGNITMAKPQADAGELKSLERERTLYANEFAKARKRRESAQKSEDKDLIAAADADVLEYTAKLEESESALRSHRSETPTSAAGTAAPDITPESHAALKKGEKFFFKGKEYTKE